MKGIIEQSGVIEAFKLTDIFWDCGYVLQSKMKKGTGTSPATVNVSSTTTTLAGCYSSPFLLF